VNATYGHLTEAQRELLFQCEQLSRDILEPVARAGQPGRVNRPLVAALAEHSLLARVLQRQREIPALELCLIREGLARHSPESETAFAVQCLGAYPILVAGRAAVVDDWMPRIARGTSVAAFALTEPSGGSDAGALALRAEPDGEGFRLTGEKAFISNAPEADVYSVFARTTADAGARGVTCFAVPGNSAGLSGESTPLLSDHPIGRLRFDSVRVSREQVVGEIDHGFAIAMRTLDLFRPSVGAFAVGMSQAALDAAVQHAANRTAFGRRLSEFQGVTHQLAAVATSVQAARLLVHAAATAYDSQVPGRTKAAAMAKLFATEAATAAVDVAIQVFGARALQHDHLLGHLYREVRGTRIYEGTSEVQREIVARELFRELAIAATN
jgi:alkylation response protein AidB-like acyl-CoA dehydrogenase